MHLPSMLVQRCSESSDAMLDHSPFPLFNRPFQQQKKYDNLSTLPALDVLSRRVGQHTARSATLSGRSLLSSLPQQTARSAP